MRNLTVVMGHLHIIRQSVRTFATAQRYGKEDTKCRNIDQGSLKTGHYLLKNYIQRPPLEKCERLPFSRKKITVSDVEPAFKSCQACVKVCRSILNENKFMSTKQVEVLDALQRNIWEFHILDLTFEQLFDLIERSIMKKYKCEYFLRALFMQATSKFDTYEWDASSISLLMLFTTVFRQVPRSLMDKVHTFVCLNIKLFSLKELILIMNAFYVGKFNYGHADFLASSVIDKALTNLRDLNSRDLLMIIKLCQSHREDNFTFLFDVARTLMRDENDLKKHCRNFIDVAYLLKQYAKYKLDVPEFVDAVINALPKPADIQIESCEEDNAIKVTNTNPQLTIRLKDIGTISWALGCLAYDVGDTTGIHSYLEKLFVAIHRIDNRNAHSFIREFFFGQVVAGKFTPVFIQYMRDHSSKHLKEQLEKNNYTRKGMLYIFLRVCMDIDCPDVELKKIPRGEMEHVMKQDIAVPSYQYFEDFTNYMNELLQGKFVVHHTVLPYITNLMEIRLDENNRPVPFTPTKYEDLLEEMMDKELMSKRGRRIVILQRTQSSCLQSGKHLSMLDRPSGLTLVSKRHLYKLGYESCLVTLLHSPLPERVHQTVSMLVRDFGVQVNSAVLKRVERRCLIDQLHRTGHVQNKTH
ncbi:uncharacterized protein LOC132562072 [Ylistrum balloti]|uniref:uncharacterized protein LOC132562072 n=1 Tax=Ylistrum balloti TaxID=509963 RepID=UPI0029058F00|nr:uncharacterized protein LOC132562072 [Ylistrum balloti]